MRNQIKCGLLLNLSSPHNTFPVILPNRPLIFNRLHPSNRHFASQEATPKCNLLCNIQECKAWVKATLLPVEAFTNLIKALSNSCNQIRLVRRGPQEGLGTPRQDLAVIGATNRVVFRQHQFLRLTKPTER